MNKAMRSSLCLAVVGCLAVILPSRVSFSMVDQSNLLASGWGWTAMSWDKTQTFRPGLPLLTGVDLDILTANPHLGDDTIVVEVRRSSELLGSASRIVEVGFEGLLHFDFPEPIAVSVGESYELEVPGTKDTFGWKFSAGDLYPDGVKLLGGGGVVFEEGHDWLFQTHGMAVPEPATLFLLGSSMLMLAGKRTRGKRGRESM